MHKTESNTEARGISCQFCFLSFLFTKEIQLNDTAALGCDPGVWAQTVNGKMI